MDPDGGIVGITGAWTAAGKLRKRYFYGIVPIRAGIVPRFQVRVLDLIFTIFHGSLAEFFLRLYLQQYTMGYIH
jgi:hypothetical protein